MAGTPVLLCAASGPALGRPDDALDLIGAAGSERVQLILLPAERLDPAFFDLASGVAGEFLQKLVNYGLRLVIAGDISGRLAASKALRDFVRESNRGDQIWFVADAGELERRLTDR